MANYPASSIKLTIKTRMNCLACAQGKQVKEKQSKKDTGNNSPIDVIGGVICSNLKSPMTPRDLLGNRYLDNFIDHRSNYCRVFLAKSKDVAALKFKHILVSFEREFHCRIHVLRVVNDTPRHDVSEKCSVAQPVWYGSTIPKVTGSIPVGRVNKKVKPSGSGVWGAPALSCQTVTSPTFGTFGCLETHDQN
uniref:Uncharacterized protein n=1 Tax=Peronospora matthiolae TaxID=2874970 RepID=A0AAV1U1K8_9STRA